MIQFITIPKYITKVQTSPEIQPIYYSKYDSKGISKTWTYDNDDDSNNRDLGDEKYDPIRENFSGPPYELPAPKTKILKLLKGNLEWNKQGYLADKESGERLIANSRRAGKPSYDPISGNRIISANSTGRQAKYKNAIKDFYRPFIKDQLEPIDRDLFPVRLEMYMHTVVNRNGNLFDLSNLWFYRKYFEDVLFEVDPPIIPDDNVKFITDHRGPTLIPIDDWEDREIKFEFHQDNRDEIDEHEFWNS